jgi:hypothetical protein
MEYSTKTTNRYLNMFKRQSLFLSEARFSIWNKIMWEFRGKYHKGEIKTIFPAMLGEYSFEGKLYCCTFEGVTEIPHYTTFI